ncbi:Ff.00g077970.m01.CDS01 [Fusarium sp. VM40]|nr:Ff.00g077970.m01.CDS01 [Fusarium sp. VM40]
MVSRILEFTKANYNPFPGEGWCDYLRFALPCYDAELTAELVLWEKILEPGTRYIAYRDGSVMNTQARAPPQPG